MNPTLERTRLDGKGARVLEALAAAGEPLTQGELRDRLDFPVHERNVSAYLKRALLDGLVAVEGSSDELGRGRSARWRVLPIAYAHRGSGTRFGTRFGPTSLPKTPCLNGEAKAAAAVSSSSYDQARTRFDLETRVRDLEERLRRAVIALDQRPNDGTEGRAHPERRSPPLPLPALDEEVLALRDEIVKREGKGKPGFTETVHRRLVDPEYVKMKRAWLTGEREKDERREKARTIAPSSSSREEEAARARREELRLARHKLGAEVGEIETLSLELAREELPQAHEQRVRLRAVEIAAEWVLERARKLTG